MLWMLRLSWTRTMVLACEACARLVGLTKLTREEMRIAGYDDSVREIDVCKE